MDTVIGAALAGVFALLGVYLAQRHERALAARAEERQRIEWVRDDVGRSYEHRRDAYLDFVQSWRRHYDGAWRAEAFGGPDPDFDWMDALYDKFVALQIFGTRSVVEAASVTMENLNNYAQQGDEVDHALFEALQEAIRQDLAIPDRPLSLDRQQRTTGDERGPVEA